MDSGVRRDPDNRASLSQWNNRYCLTNRAGIFNDPIPLGSKRLAKTRIRADLTMSRRPAKPSALHFSHGGELERKFAIESRKDCGSLATYLGRYIVGLILSPGTHPSGEAVLGGRDRIWFSRWSGVSLTFIVIAINCY